ncbi:hypothetical protein AT05_10040 [Schleiferia thermophila str. Yellowstone]|nr:hypothetical protein AT05_10040 [Schleiferia thermophila str. Yellowstone]
MNAKKSDMLLVLVAFIGFLIWNYPILKYLSLPSLGIFKLLFLFSSWIAIVLFTRKIVQKRSIEK